MGPGSAGRQADEVSTTGTTGTAEAVVDLHAERLQVRSAQVPVERVRVRRRVVTEVRTVEVEVRREELEVVREALDPFAADDPAGTRVEDVPHDLVLVLHEEVPVVSLQVRPVERVRIGVDRVSREVEVTETVAHEEVEVSSDLDR